MPSKDRSEVVETSFLSDLSFEGEADDGSGFAGYFEEYLKKQLARNDYDHRAIDLAPTSMNSSQSSLHLPEESAVQMYGNSMWTRAPAMYSGESSSGASVSSIAVSAGLLLTLTMFYELTFTPPAHACIDAR